MRKFPRIALALVAVAVCRLQPPSRRRARARKKAAATAEVCVLLPDTQVVRPLGDRTTGRSSPQRSRGRRHVQHRQRPGQRADAAQPGASSASRTARR